jgi:AdoMet-dependent heme synthase
MLSANEFPMTYDEPLHTLHYNVTNTCNLSCKFCYADSIRAKTVHIPLDRIRLLAREAREVGCKRVILSGGEIFVRDDWFEICEAFSVVGIAVSLVSNGTLISDDRLRRIKLIPGFSILISLDGDEEVHDRIRGMNGSHRKTLATIAKFSEHAIDFQVNSTIIKTNLSEIDYLTTVSARYDVSVRFSLLNRYNGRGQVVAPEALDVAEVLELRSYCHNMRKQGSRIFINLPPVLQFPEDVLPIRSPSCGWTKSYCGITNEGYVTICGVAGADERLYQGNILDQSFAKIWRESELFNHLRSLKANDLKGVCRRCRVRDVCGGACRLSAFKSSDDFTASYTLCEAFHEAGLIPASALDPEVVEGTRETSLQDELPAIAV